MDGKDIIAYIDPIFRFCCHRLNNRYDAEDLSAEILCHVLEGLGKYEIESLDSWVWRIAHNRYARFVEARKKQAALLSDAELFEIEEDYCVVDERSLEEEFEPVFLSLHRLSSEYRNIFVDYYIGELSVKQLSRKYTLPETTIKWRLNVGRGKIRKWMGEEKMDKVYQRINWNTWGCNGNIDTDKYLHSQAARAICRAAYEKPLTVEEISACTGIPAMYIEDEIPRLEYGEALRKTGNKYVTDFIVFRLADRASVEEPVASAIKELADCCETVFWGRDEELKKIGFYGSSLGMERLGYIFVPCFLRQRIRDLKNNRLNLPDGNYPPRKDGGYGWYIVEETPDERENASEYNMGCRGLKDNCGHIYYYWTNQYSDRKIHFNDGVAWMCRQDIMGNSPEGMIPEDILSEDDIVRLLEDNLIKKCEKGYRLNFVRFTRKQFRDARELLASADKRLDELLCSQILTVRKEFEKFVPGHLHSQINQWVTCFSYRIVSYVLEELMRRGWLAEPDRMRPFTEGLFYVEGDFVEN